MSVATCALPSRSLPCASPSQVTSASRAGVTAAGSTGPALPGCAKRRLQCCNRRFDLLFLPDRRGVLDAALVPEVVEASGDLERRVRAHVALVDLTIVASALDDLHRPDVVEADGLAELTFGAEQALDVGVGRLQHLVDVGAGHAQL